MSGSRSLLNPAPERVGAFRAGTVDTRGYDFTPDLGAVGDPIVSIDSIIVQRRDSRPMDIGDLTITPLSKASPWLDATGYIVQWWQTADPIGVVDYQIGITVTSQEGRVITHDVYQLVVPVMG